MAKREHSEFAKDAAAPTKPASKRAKSQLTEPDALSYLLAHVDQIAEIADLLKTERSKQVGDGPKADELEAATKKRILHLSKKLLPAFQTLGSKTPEVADSEQTPEAELSPQIPAHISVTKWTSATISNTFPPLPAVLDPVLETAALTHAGKTKHRSDISYERLEWIGDAYLELIASSLIYQTFPQLEPGKCSQYREMLVRNATLSEYSCHYGLDKRADFPDEFALGGRPTGTTASNKQRMKAQGDIFEAYVGAVILSDPENGIRRASEWLKALWGSKLKRHICDEERRTPTTAKEPISHKTMLEVAIGSKGVKLEYRDMPSGGKKDRDTNLPLVTVGCFLQGWGETDKLLGFGSALSKKEAGQKAAQAALDNKKLIKVYTEKKKIFNEARAQAAAQADAFLVSLQPTSHD
ncbi:RNase3 domain-containing protein [Podospora didyma]|uniref:RNase3 domain-containing protein n=1 Tax=Podospora didyma TaxID=330526 RepID=A0AAE0NST6_9PEZI|nr:RNase3 domain-containing protein [Podospora didyma]